MKLVYSKERFVAKARIVHGDKYNYDESDYHGCKIPIKIICPIHGEFWQKPDGHLQGCGCQKCASESISKFHLSTTEEFIRRAKEKFGDRFDYSMVNYVKISVLFWIKKIFSYLCKVNPFCFQ